MGKHGDLGHIVDPQHRKWIDGDLEGVSPHQTLFALDLELMPNTQSHLLAPGRYLLDLRVAAANCAPVPVKIEINCTGTWFNDETRMFHDGIGLRVV